MSVDYVARTIVILHYAEGNIIFIAQRKSKMDKVKLSAILFFKYAITITLYEVKRKYLIYYMSTVCI